MRAVAGLRTPLNDAHRALGARMIDFGGWDMPVSYPAGTIKEHKAVREAAGVFDVCHMGEAFLRGPRATEAVQRLTTNDVGGVAPGKAVYTLLCRPDGGIVDDCIFYKRAEDEYFVIINASNRHKDVAWMREQIGGIVDLDDVSDATALIAVQGPKAAAILDGLAGGTLAKVGTFCFTDTTVAGVAVTAGRTGYTGEDGFELACKNADAPALWQAIIDAGVQPCGLGSRDSLRLESRLPLYGNDLDDTTSPLEAGLGWAVKLDRPWVKAGGDFLGRSALVAQKASGLARVLTGFRIEDRAIARHGYPVVDRGRPAGEQVIGTVTSGGPGISITGAIGLAYLPPSYAAEGTALTLDCRGKDVAATVVKGKFYKRA
ncbi:MAG: glycine cleavage system aminomethyltransferase GcvT [Myxococcales bacterium]|nr:glycine cleavage system aminomethyltransferase GcvT [Myxococcales bacterium]MBK7198629.1 glycine cleavage system aminomethyltransferase GcvT [Myxococcales bacterium]MBP6844450.1 glycine cleavage system aminomethyltransferase GcvT [Kofleriaceae bacterium]